MMPTRPAPRRPLSAGASAVRWPSMHAPSSRNRTGLQRRFCLRPDAATSGAENQSRHGAAQPQGAAAARQRRVCHEIVMGDERFLGRMAALIGAVRLHGPALPVVLKIGDHDLLEHLLVDRWILDRAEQFDTAIEIARHPVGRGDEHLGVLRRQRLAVAKADDTGVFEEPADDALDPDMFAEARHPRTKAADAAQYKADLDASLGSRIKP